MAAALRHPLDDSSTLIVGSLSELKRIWQETWFMLHAGTQIFLSHNIFGSHNTYSRRFIIRPFDLSRKTVREEIDRDRDRD